MNPSLIHGTMILGFLFQKTAGFNNRLHCGQFLWTDGQLSQKIHSTPVNIVHSEICKITRVTEMQFLKSDDCWIFSFCYPGNVVLSVSPPLYNSEADWNISKCIGDTTMTKIYDHIPAKSITFPIASVVVCIYQHWHDNTLNCVPAKQ